MSIHEYEKVRVTTDVVIVTTENEAVDDARKVPTKTLQVLLIKRDEEPFNNMWTLPGVFIDSNKGLTECLKEKLFKQKTGIENIYCEQLATYGDNINRDPRDRVISIAYLALADKETLNKTMVQGSKQKQWFNVKLVKKSGEADDIELINEITGEKLGRLGFDHKQMIIDALNRLANKIMYTDIGFNLVSTEFTVKELQMAYECTLQKELSGFRRLVENKIIETGQTTTDVKEKADLHRPAKLYRRK